MSEKAHSVALKAGWKVGVLSFIALGFGKMRAGEEIAKANYKAAHNSDGAIDWKAVDQLAAGHPASAVFSGHAGPEEWYNFFNTGATLSAAVVIVCFIISTELASRPRVVQ